MPYTVHALAVDAGLVGTDHSGKQRLGVEVLADVMRAFVDVEEKAYAVPCTVAKVAPGFPQGFTCKAIYLAAGGTARENGHCKVYMAL